MKSFNIFVINCCSGLGYGLVCKGFTGIYLSVFSRMDSMIFWDATDFFTDKDDVWVLDLDGFQRHSLALAFHGWRITGFKRIIDKGLDLDGFQRHSLALAFHGWRITGFKRIIDKGLDLDDFSGFGMGGFHWTGFSFFRDIG